MSDDKCKVCDGNGKMICPGCNGEGKDRSFKAWSPCATCNGKKTIICPKCKGSGVAK